MKKAILSIFILFGCLSSFAQNIPVFRQFFFNPYFFNPAYVGSSGHTEVSLAYRQQWLGFNDAPTGSGFSFQLPTRRRASFGLNYVSQDVVSLNNSTGSFSFGYKVPFSEKHSLRFGISIGLGMYKLRLGDTDYSDDFTILSAANNTIYASGNFGVLYSYKKLKVGFALPELLGIKNVSSYDNLSQFRNQFYSLSYVFNVNQNLEIEPYFLYRVTGDFQNFWELASVFSWRKKIWAGTSYREHSGLGFVAGARMFNSVAFSYSFELPPISKNFINTSSHELHLNLQIDNLKKRNKQDDETEYR
jgi:type IX secretion system PorP/SprF family membrane protein